MVSSTIGDPGRSLSNAASSSDGQVSRLEMFDDLRREEAAERSVGLRAQVGERVGFGDVESLLPADVHHRAVDVDAARRDPLVAQERQELAAPAADVQDVARAA